MTQYKIIGEKDGESKIQINFNNGTTKINPISFYSLVRKDSDEDLVNSSDFHKFLSKYIDYFKGKDNSNLDVSMKGISDEKEGLVRRVTALLMEAKPIPK